ncbi:hypothetical protein B0J11DRAFT_301482 [Dendryphion nanum]|uniref:Uncharacterized protein n=1 Tax=Dendryphion nanum TaxID=256645 RepID=A0A9P9DUI4_9PLEO|nr:hypothetical protein B0J11DRAFT_301482 [Dendryphion nanum]
MNISFTRPDFNNIDIFDHRRETNKSKHSLPEPLKEVQGLTFHSNNMIRIEREHPLSYHTPDYNDVGKEKKYGLAPLSPQSTTTVNESQMNKALKASFPSDLDIKSSLANKGLYRRWLRRLEIIFEFLGVCETRTLPGAQRLRWTCTCGKNIYDDFVELQPGALEDLRLRLQHRETPTDYNSGSAKAWGRINSIFSWSVTSLMHILRGHGGQTRSNPNTGQLPTHNPPISSMNQFRATTPVSSNPLYLLLCINSGRFGADLHQESMQQISCDQELFHFLRRIYAHRRNRLLRLFSLRTMNSIQFVKFAADMSAKVDIHSHSTYCDKLMCICVPPESKVEPTPNSEYRCNPIPANHIPPFGENYMMHLYSSPSCVNPLQVAVYNQIPKRTCGQLMVRPENVSEGWGLHFREGWHLVKIWALICSLFVGGSLIFGVLYSVLKKDVQSAFGIASYLVTTATVGLGYLAIRSR